MAEKTYTGELEPLTFSLVQRLILIQMRADTYPDGGMLPTTFAAMQTELMTTIGRYVATLEPEPVTLPAVDAEEQP